MITEVRKEEENRAILNLWLREEQPQKNKGGMIMENKVKETNQKGGDNMVTTSRRREDYHESMAFAGRRMDVMSYYSNETDYLDKLSDRGHLIGELLEAHKEFEQLSCTLLKELVVDLKEVHDLEEARGIVDEYQEKVMALINEDQSAFWQTGDMYKR